METTTELFSPDLSPIPASEFPSSTSPTTLAASSSSSCTSSESLDLELGPFGRVTRSLRKKLSGVEPTPVVYDKDDDESFSPKSEHKLGRRGRPPATKEASRNTTPKTGRRGKKRHLIQRERLVTALSVNRMPFLYEEILKRLEPEKRDRVDLFELQNLIVATNLDEHTESNENTVVEQVLNILRSDDEHYMKDPNSTRRRIMDSKFLSEKQADEDALQRYEEYINSDENQKLLFYRTDSATRHVWTDQDLSKFFEAFKKYGNGPTSNRLIAKAIGPNVHPNHVSHFKSQLRKKQKQTEKQKKTVGAAKKEGGSPTPTISPSTTETAEDITMSDIMAAAAAVNKAIKKVVTKKGASLAGSGSGTGTGSEAVKGKRGRKKGSKKAGRSKTSKQKTEEEEEEEEAEGEEGEEGEGEGEGEEGEEDNEGGSGEQAMDDEGEE